jgi:hypothetical protein
MALKPCRECGAQVSTKVEICPRCGVHSPTASNPIVALDPSDDSKQDMQHKRLFVVVMIVVIAVLWLLLPKDLWSPKEPGCRTDWTKCANDAELVDKYSGWTRVETECKSEADSRARYKTVWPPVPFGTFLKGNENVTSGIVVAIESDAQFQNGFGAMVRSRVACTYDLRAQRVISVDISER